MKKLYVGKVDPRFEISKEQIEKYGLKEGAVITYSGMAGQIIVSEDTNMEDIDIKEVSNKKVNNQPDIKETEETPDIKEVEEDEVDIKEI